MACICEYVWLGGRGEFRSKTRVCYELRPEKIMDIIQNPDMIPEWNYDGSSTGQAHGSSSEIVLRPVACYPNPVEEKLYVLCDTYTPDGSPLPNNHRPRALEIFEKYKSEQPWYGIEQEYFIMDKEGKPLGFKAYKHQGQFYCSVGARNAFGREIAEEHLKRCLSAGIKVSGINAEVAPGQWEFQIGPVEGIASGDSLLMARYFLERVAEEKGYDICWDPKPLKGDWNGSGCHTNFSTIMMREGKNEEKTGLDIINESIAKLEAKHKEHMEVYGDGNDERMTGEHETASFNKFSWGVGDRGASVRIGNDTQKAKKGYFEDRRPSSNMNPYLVTSKLLETIME